MLPVARACVFGFGGKEFEEGITLERLHLQWQASLFHALTAWTDSSLLCFHRTRRGPSLLVPFFRLIYRLTSEQTRLILERKAWGIRIKGEQRNDDSEDVLSLGVTQGLGMDMTWNMVTLGLCL